MAVNAVMEKAPHLINNAGVNQRWREREREGGRASKTATFHRTHLLFCYGCLRECFMSSL